MTEAKWLECDDPLEMLEFLWSRGPISERKLRLLACACCRRIGHLFRDPSSRKAVESTELYADGCFDGLALERIAAEARAAIGGVSLESQAVEYAATAAALTATWEHIFRALEPAAVAAGCVASPENWLPEKWNEQVQQCDILRDIYGNPFCTVAIQPECLTWNDGTVRRIAQAIYEERAFDRIPILADALEDAGCTDRAILNHCRQPSEHMRGC
jgi:hypothetical protein